MGQNTVAQISWGGDPCYKWSMTRVCQHACAGLVGGAPSAAVDTAAAPSIRGHGAAASTKGAGGCAAQGSALFCALQFARIAGFSIVLSRPATHAHVPIWQGAHLALPALPAGNGVSRRGPWALEGMWAAPLPQRPTSTARRPSSEETRFGPAQIHRV